MWKAIMHRYTKMLKSLENHKIKKLIKQTAQGTRVFVLNDNLMVISCKRLIRSLYIKRILIT